MAALSYASSFLTTATNSIASASAALSKPTISSNYIISNSIPTVQIGVWKVERAKHHSNGKEVSIWTVEKSSLSNGRNRGEKALEIIRKEVSSLSRLRHPSILEMAEPMEESRSSVVFATGG